ncbi:UNVERIFIED_ORG: hypothetical protein J2X79_000240 [Arthrobacter globiformis]|nr:hypothetical protein [Arthrobacter globiformis]
MAEPISFALVGVPRAALADTALANRLMDEALAGHPIPMKRAGDAEAMALGSNVRLEARVEVPQVFIDGWMRAGGGTDAQ